MSYELNTKCIHLEEQAFNDPAKAVSFPIYQTATFAHDGFGKSSGYDYSRVQNPTREHLEKIIAELENGIDALAFSSGMAAITAVMELFSPGDNIIVDKDLYGGSVRLFSYISEKNGIGIRIADCGGENIETYIDENTKAVYIETPTNPMMNVIDIEKVASVTSKNGLLLIVDNTFMSPYLQNPLKFGADIVIHSGTKYLGGHNDTLAGFLITNSDEISLKLRFIYKTTGACLAPMDSWLILRGIQTLSVRIERAQENAEIVVKWLLDNPKVGKVFYPGIKDSSGYEVMKKQARGFGAMISFEVNSAEAAKTVINSTTLIRFAESLGGTETLITYPVSQTHADVPIEQREANGITERLLRLSIGIESVKDIISDLENAFSRIV